ncbi:hypothetical protein RSJ42_05865 [Methanosarcina hadiensis]|uniref:hypothetical protein n=1 Tax=Methanosarcina hadiensis TaxID=3078083 RepID=UPI003977B7F5
MGKNGKKLTEEEIEERRNETYKMMAAISGKPISELMDNEVHRGNYGEKDCLIKQMFLKNLVEPISSRQLFETLRKQGYDAKYTTFCGLLYRYQDYGYVEKKSAKKPFLFGLTDEGLRHDKNPYLAREELARKRMNFIYSQIEKELVNHPEALKNLVETITQMNIGSSNYNPVIVGAGSQYHDNFGNEELKREIGNNIYNKDFWKSTDNEKLKSLVNGILNGSLSYEDKEQLLIDALDEAANSHKGSIVVQKKYNPSKSIGERRYYEYLIKGINQPVTRSIYEAIPFRFIMVANEIRLKSIPESGIYNNNQDGKIMDFDYVLRNVFQNRMMIKAQNNDNELIFFYTDGYTNYKITTMSLNDYNKVKNKSQSSGIKLKINH